MAPRDPHHDAPSAAPSPGACHGARLVIDLAAIAENWRRLGAQAPGVECAAVVKADAYGCGLDAVASHLWREGCRTFFVAHLAEGLTARTLLPEATLYVLNGLVPGTEHCYAEARLRPVLGSVEELADWASFSQGRHASALHVDTGMNRLGIGLQDVADLAPRLTDAGVALVMSHLVSAERPDEPVNARQVAAFARARGLLPGIPGSLANSSGIYLGAPVHHDLLRPGFALYGGNPTPYAPDNPMQPVVRLEAPILQVRAVEAGDTAGYNACWKATGPRRLATLSLGYADGYPRAGSNAGHALVEGIACPILGLISMDLIILDVTNAHGAQRGSTATLIGDALDIDTVGHAAGTIGYEILTGLGSRYVRCYKNG